MPGSRQNTQPTTTADRTEAFARNRPTAPDTCHHPRRPEESFQPRSWAVYGEYQYPEVHRLIVDAYMSQHATFATPAGRRSVVVQLVGLYLVLERGTNGAAVGRSLGQVPPDKRDVPSLAPKPPPGPLTIASVLAAADFEDHDRRGRAWALSVWTVWAPHHAWIQALAKEALARRRVP